MYRGVFENDVKYYGFSEIEKTLGFDREQFIIFALFTGSDYTEGIRGIGLINAMEIIKAFDSFERLVTFREWAKTAD